METYSTLFQRKPHCDSDSDRYIDRDSDTDREVVIVTLTGVVTVTDIVTVKETLTESGDR